MDDDAFLRKYNSDGTELWTVRTGGGVLATFSAVVAESTGDVYVAGSTSGTLPGQTTSFDVDAFIRKYSSTGAELWTRQFGTNQYDAAGAVALDEGNAVYVTGYTSGGFSGYSNAGSADWFLRKYDRSGGELWTRQFGTVQQDYGGLRPGARGGWQRERAARDLHPTHVSRAEQCRGRELERRSA